MTFALENSDVISFHCYASGTVLEKFIKTLLPYGRPMVCTEYMRRPISTFEEAMPIFKKYNVGAINFGLTAGKCNFHYPWNKVDEKGRSIPGLKSLRCGSMTSSMPTVRRGTRRRWPSSGV